MAIAYWRLPLRFDPEQLRADLELVAPDEWQAHYNRAGYDGDWEGVALRSPRGAATPLYALGQDGFEDSPLLERCAYFASVLQAFSCPLESVRLLRLRPGALIHEHRDYKLGLEDGTLRVHIPISTNPGVRFLLHGRVVPMAVGEAWYVNVNLPHQVENLGATDRVHLVVDGLVNDWVRTLLADGDFATAEDQPLPLPPRPRPASGTAAASGPEVTDAIIAFLREIGLSVREGALGEDSFLPGVAIVAGGLLVDRARLRHPGDLLHEAGHLAVAAPARRAQMNGNVGGDPAEEMMAIAWSFAAGSHLALDPAIIFHDDGYRGGASSLREAFTGGGNVGLPMLQWVGMAFDQQQAAARNLPAYPAMYRWLRPESSM